VRRLILSAGLAMVVAFAVPASPASALTKAQCTSYVNNYQAKSPVSGSGEMLATRCLLSRARLANGVPGLTANATLRRTAEAHAKASVANKFWSLTNGLVSHLDPGTPVPGDPNALQSLVNQQVDARIRGAGYCAGGRAFGDAEITFGATGSGGTPKAAMNFWLTDPPHRQTVLNPQLKEYGVAALAGSPFPSGTKGATYVVDFGFCTK
jgi:uncharacterized protein YkwD